MCAGQRNN